MALDHVRDFFHADALLHDPLNLETTTPVLYFTRWITHFCAPTFIFLSGTSAFLAGTNRSTKKELSLLLLSRGLWLILLEMTVITFGWTFDVQYRTIFFQVIWAIGLGMVVLAGLIYLPRHLLLTVAILLIGFHNLLDNYHFNQPEELHFVWSALHEFGMFRIAENHLLVIAYPVMPWVGLMALGYWFGNYFRKDFPALRRRKLLVFTGGGFLAAFLVLRFTHTYGDAQLFEVQQTTWKSVFDFLDVTKYPPSLHFILLTIGPALLILAFTEQVRNKISRVLVTIGRVPFLYYLLHLYLIHSLAMVAVFASGFTWSDFNYKASIIGLPPGFGFSLGVVYVVWALVLLLLYPLCKWYAGYKTRHRHNRWLQYI
jgi:uncharacterized membrane protein